MSGERGVVLLEVVIGLVVFGAAALTTVEFLGQLGATEQQAFATERRLADQERLLAAHTLLTRADLDRRLGERRVGTYTVRVERATATLYRLSVGESTAVDLATVVFRPGSDGAR